MSRKLTTAVFLAMLVLAGAMGLKTAVTAHGSNPEVLLANSGPVPAPF